MGQVEQETGQHQGPDLSGQVQGGIARVQTYQELVIHSF